MALNGCHAVVTLLCIISENQCSIPLTHCLICPLQTLNKVSRGEHLILERAREVILKELEEETYERLRKIKKSILEPVQGAGSFSFTGNLDLRKKYASMSAADVVLAVFSNAEGVFSPRMASVSDTTILILI